MEGRDEGMWREGERGGGEVNGRRGRKKGMCRGKRKGEGGKRGEGRVNA